MKKWHTLFKVSLVTLFSALFIAIIYFVTVAPNDFGKDIPSYLATKASSTASNAKHHVMSVVLIGGAHGNAAFTHDFLSVGKLGLHNHSIRFDINQHNLGAFFQKLGDFDPTFGADMVTAGLGDWDAQFGNLGGLGCTDAASVAQCVNFLAADGAGSGSSLGLNNFGINPPGNPPDVNVLALNLISNGNQPGAGGGSSPSGGSLPQALTLIPQPLATPLPATSLLFASGVLLLLFSGLTFSKTKMS